VVAKTDGGYARRVMRRLYIIGLTFVFIVGIVLAITLHRSTSETQIAFSQSPVQSRPNEPAVDVSTYHLVTEKIEHERAGLSLRYRRAASDSERESTLVQARESFLSSVSNIFPYWYGTVWDFHGTTETPGKGKIACGYFVSTVLRDLGLKVQRTKLAQQASENIILSLTTNDHIKRFRESPLNKFVEEVKALGAGLYVVGLDVHVGFILNTGDDVFFVHSSYGAPYCVVKERAAESRILGSSRYRVLGKLSDDDNLILKWLKADQFFTRT